MQGQYCNLAYYFQASHDLPVPGETARKCGSSFKTMTQDEYRMIETKQNGINEKEVWHTTLDE